MPPTAIAAVLTLLTEAPQLVNGAKALWSSFATFHNAGLIKLTDEQVAAMNAAGVTLDKDVAALEAAAGVRVN